MIKKLLVYLPLILIVVSLAYADIPSSWYGYVTLDSATAADGVIVDAYISGSIAATTTVGAVQSSGYYLMHVPGNVGDSVSFKIYGNNVSQAAQTWVAGFNHPALNLTATSTASGSSCPTYSGYSSGTSVANLGCAGGYCVHDLCRAASTSCGDGYCDSGESCTNDDSACNSGYACTDGCESTGGDGGTGGSSGGGGITTPVDVNIDSHMFTSLTPAMEVTSSIAKTNIPFFEYKFIVKNQIDKCTITTKGLSSKPETLPDPSGNTYKYVEVTTSGFTMSDIFMPLGIKFKVAKPWFTDNSYDKDTVKLWRYTTAWDMLETKLTGETATDYLYEAATPGFSHFVITAEKSAEATLPEEPTAAPEVPEPPAERGISIGEIKQNDGVNWKWSGTTWVQEGTAAYEQIKPAEEKQPPKEGIKAQKTGLIFVLVLLGAVIVALVVILSYHRMQIKKLKY